MNTTREDKTRRTNTTGTEKTAVLLWQRERSAKVSVFLCARGKSAVFARFAFVSLVVLQVCVVENLREKCLSLFLSV